LIKSKRLYKLLLEINNNKSIEEAISSFKPPIFWKDKETVKQQIKNWSLSRAENLIYKTNELELLIKKILIIQSIFYQTLLLINLTELVIKFYYIYKFI
jgi:hypothetical protein